jgi:hypothetical protein
MTLLKILRDMELSVTVHGFRSAFRDWVAEQTDYPAEVAEAALAHTISNKTEAAYRRTDFLAKRRLLMSEWATFCIGAIPATTSADSLVSTAKPDRGASQLPSAAHLVLTLRPSRSMQD